MSKTPPEIYSDVVPLQTQAFRRFVGLNIVAKTLFPLACEFMPALAESAQAPAGSDARLSDTKPYTLHVCETFGMGMARFYLTAMVLKTFNEFPTFSAPFERMTACDELDNPITADLLTSLRPCKRLGWETPYEVYAGVRVALMC